MINNSKNEKLKSNSRILELKAVMNGEIIRIEEVADSIFSEKMIGNGYGLLPSGKKLYSPVDGVIEEIASTKHAVYLSTNDNEKILIHIGIDTIKLDGQGFETNIESGMSVKKGDLLVTFDPDFIRESGFNPVVSVILLDQDNRQTDFIVYPKKEAQANETVALQINIHEEII